MTLSLKDRVCVVTGAEHGIGKAVAQGFVQRGAIVVATSLETPGIDGAAWNTTWDVSQPQAAREVMDEVVRRFGRVDALVANAGIYPRQPWDQITDDDWRRVLQVNLDGTWHGIQAAAPHMVRQSYGKIVTVTSVEVSLGQPLHAHYMSAKAGVIGLTRSMARALGPSGVRVNTLMPGAVRTEGELALVKDPKHVAMRLAERQCLPDRLVPEAIEPSFAFLCAAESDAITGQTLCVDHGLIHW